MQNRGEAEGQLLFTATGETANTEPTSSTESDNIGFLTATSQPESVDVDSLVNCLNVKQRAVFNIVVGWAREKVKYSNSVTRKNIKPLSLFIRGGAGVGKSRLIETSYAFLTKTFNSYTGSPEKVKVILLAPTGASVINISGTTINSGLAIPINLRGLLPRLSDQIKCKLHTLFSELEVIIIDKISMVSNKTLLNVHKKLCEIFGCSEANPFVGKMVLLLGQVFASLSSLFGAMCNLWTNFMCELTEVMRQQGDKEFITLNSMRIGNLSDDHARMLESRQISIETLSNDVNVLFAENDPKDQYNCAKLEKLQEQAVEIPSIDN